MKLIKEGQVWRLNRAKDCIIMAVMEKRGSFVDFMSNFKSIYTFSEKELSMHNLELLAQYNNYQQAIASKEFKGFSNG